MNKQFIQDSFLTIALSAIMPITFWAAFSFTPENLMTPVPESQTVLAGAGMVGVALLGALNINMVKIG